MDLFRYNATAVFAGPNEAVSENNSTNINQLFGIQGVSFDFGEPLTDIESTEGKLERVAIAPNEVNLSFNYFLRDGENERSLGLVVDAQSGIFSNFWNDERNYFVALKNDGGDLYTYSGYDLTVFAFGQGLMTSYGIQGEVKKPLTANASFSFLNVGVSSSGNSVQLPIVNKQYGTTITSYGLDTYMYTGSGDSAGSDYSGSSDSNWFSGSGTNSSGDLSGYYVTGSGDTTDYSSLNALFTIPFVRADNAPLYAITPGDIRLELPEDSTFAIAISGYSGAHIQSFDLSFALPRDIDRPLNYVFPRTRPLDPPIEVRLSVNAYVNKHKFGMLNSRLCSISGSTLALNIYSRCAPSGIDHYFTGDGASGINFSLDDFSFLFTGQGSQTDFDNDVYSYLYDNNPYILSLVMKGMRLDSTSVNLSMGDFELVTFNWSNRLMDYRSIATPSVTMFAPYS